MKIWQKFLLCVFIIPLASCGYFYDTSDVNKFNDDSYLKAKSVAPLKIPEELESTTYIEPYYPAPPGEYPERGEPPISQLPPGMGELLEEPQAK